MEKRTRESGDSRRCVKQSTKKLYAPLVKVELVLPVEEVSTTASVSKVVNIDDNEAENVSDEISGYRLIDTTILQCIFNCLACPECFKLETLSLIDINAKKKGLSRYLCLKCSCGFARHFYSSKTTQPPNKVGMKLFDVNIRMLCGMRAIGGGYSALEKLCGYLNMPEPMTENNFDKLSNTIKTATQEISEEYEECCQ